ncbi:predicted protein [Chaetoceros tenuissimus]|uniref:Uncharacterized protein n=1 Tax=Chaetoceros tenuissimus TaxID=426638 RepID=A0AAD3H258_9STRA|nr:predicted protein [Chaetoceros tenuissimus]
MTSFGLAYEVDKIPTKPRSEMEEIYDYLVRNGCPRPESSDWRIKPIEASKPPDESSDVYSDNYSGESFDDISDDNSESS